MRRRGLLCLLVLSLLLTGCAFRGISSSENASIEISSLADTVAVYSSTVTLPTYPYQDYQAPAVDSLTRWPYFIFDQQRYLADAPSPVNKTYRTIVLENAYLRLTVLPELGGRLWQVLHKPSGNRLFYQNSVVKPSPWGPGNQLGWLALGGLEWNLPVVEHGYDWGTEWVAVPVQHSPDLATVTLSTPDDGRLLHAEITISLHADLASFEIQPTLTNISDDPLRFDYWQTAMLAPGPENSPSPELHFVLPTSNVMIHSTGDETLPASGEVVNWPSHNGRDLSILGNWDRYLGLFEYPAAKGPFVGVYDQAYNAGGVRIFPAKTAQGSKLFGLGWNDALNSNYFTDDSSAYIELHGGLAPTFFEQAELAGGSSVEWRETWYPIQGINDLTYANELVAIYLQHADSVLSVGIYPVFPVEGTLIIEKAGEEVARQPVSAQPEVPFNSIISGISKSNGEALDIRLEDQLGRVLLTYTFW